MIGEILTPSRLEATPEAKAGRHGDPAQPGPKSPATTHSPPQLGRAASRRAAPPSRRRERRPRRRR
eukprot:2606521-Alexandrium_andersonii.AAC.1